MTNRKPLARYGALMGSRPSLSGLAPPPDTNNNLWPSRFGLRLPVYSHRNLSLIVVSHHTGCNPRPMNSLRGRKNSLLPPPINSLLRKDRYYRHNPLEF